MTGSLFETLLQAWRSLTDPEGLAALLRQVGWWGNLLLAGIVFSESGLLAGLFLPGDSLLFTVGVLCGVGQLEITQICAVLVVASIAGDQCGYLLGYRTGPRIFARPDSRLFKQEYVTRTQQFYARHGGKTLIYAKFVPIIRTFAPFMAGVGRMRYRRFASFNVFGGLSWVISMTLAGYYLGSIEWIRRHFEMAVLAVIAVSLTPLALQMLKSRRRSAT
jgi:membrane-associated protein